MKTIGIKTFAACMILGGVLCAMTSCRSKHDPAPKPQRPIELSARTPWYESKGIIDNVTDLAGDGFVVWAAWSQDLGGGITKNAGDIFGENGTKAYYPDWSYMPTCYWVASTYTFAAAVPASAFNATYGRDGNPETDGNITGSFDGDELSLAFDEFDLSSSQTDLIYTFQTVDNTGSQNPVVSLQFKEHLFSQLRIKMESDLEDKTFTINSVSVYGLHKSLTGEISVESSGLNEDYLRLILEEESTSDAPYATFTKPADADWTIRSGQITDLVDGLIVFPEKFPETSTCYLKVVYDGDNEMTFTLNNGEWEAGKIYTYTLKPKAISIGDPIVTPWGTVKLPEIEIK